MYYMCVCVCVSEKCHVPELESHKMEGSCRAFWRCEGFKSVPACCPRGHSYTQGSGCVEDPSCQDFCGHMRLLQAKGISLLLVAGGFLSTRLLNLPALGYRRRRNQGPLLQRI